MTTRCWFLTAALFLFPAITQTPDATVNGTVTDTTGAVIPGVTVTALHTATGNTFFAVTDDRGHYRIPVRVGMYRLTFDLQGFATIGRQFEALVGQTLMIKRHVMRSTVHES